MSIIRTARGSTLVIVAVAGLLALSASCSRSDSGRSQSPSSAPDATEEQQLTAVQRFERDCASDELTPDCTDLLITIAQTAPTDALPLLTRTVSSACQDPDTPVCRTVVEALAATDNLQAIEALLVLDAPPPEVTLAGVDRTQLTDAMGVLCKEVPQSPGCQPLVAMLADSGVTAAIEHQRRQRLHEIVAAAVAQPSEQQVSALQKSLPNGPASIPGLLALSASSAVDHRERSLIERTIVAYGAAARPYLVDAIKSEAMEIGLRAAKVGWDRAQLEHDDPALLEGPKRSVEVTDAEDFIGKQLRIYHKDGTTREGILKRIDDDILYVETRVGGGVMTTQIKRSDVERIQF